VQRRFTDEAADRLGFTDITDITDHPTAWIPAIVATPAFLAGFNKA